ncbi:hypothetical protein [Clostridium butyricum]|uniref:Gp134 n=1 Tax=Clostridium butyricum E4 str. BoNT E BL5262 TaxID=632245 RepID=C4IFF8_CLOBU|nr:hypothetical protein [Clostridium butyricum]EDT75159.1 gp134 [Clostridium butyricum 5521]EEP53839.1 gp134 [Clostridium butyricum E4 str. BoNT E BL5262]NFL32855.1 hypothetical protein [Clostridium butyricum]NFS20229.1 hypothetical protein [Clostridium butyricum]
MAQTIKFKRGTSANLGSLTLQAGEPAFCTDNGKLYIGNGTDKVLINQNNSSAVTSVGGKTGAVTLVKGDVGLGNVDNTSDANKPISTATQTALNEKAASSHTHNYAGSSSAGGAATTALSCTGNSATSTKLATSRTIAVAGAVTGSASFDGSGNISITTTLASDIDGGTF